MLNTFLMSSWSYLKWVLFYNKKIVFIFLILWGLPLTSHKSPNLMIDCKRIWAKYIKKILTSNISLLENNIHIRSREHKKTLSHLAFSFLLFTHATFCSKEQEYVRGGFQSAVITLTPSSLGRKKG
jgi:hypothetical protein